MRRDGLWAAILAATLVAGCAGHTTGRQAAAKVPHQPATLSPAQTAQLHAGIRKRLRDPDSARFGPFRAASQGDIYIACGMVNARNAYGGYTGEQPYFAEMTRMGDVDLMIGNDATAAMVVRQGCENFGLAN